MESRAKAKQGIEVQSSHIAHQKLCLAVRLRIFQQPYDSGIRMSLHDAIITQFQKSYDPKYHILKEITFLSVLQGLLDRKSLFKFAIHIAQFKIQPEDWSKCQSSFYGYARELFTLREGIAELENKQLFDLEVTFTFIKS